MVLTEKNRAKAVLPSEYSLKSGTFKIPTVPRANKNLKRNQAKKQKNKLKKKARFENNK